MLKLMFCYQSNIASYITTEIIDFLRSQTLIHHTFDTAVRYKLGKNIELN